MLIYKWTNKSNGKSYIGQTTKTLSKRIKTHINTANIGSSLPLHCAIRKYGINSFIIEKIAEAKTIEGLNALEEHYIKLTNCLAPNGYNLNSGGRNFAKHPDTILKMSVSAKRRILKDNGAQFAAVQLKGRETLKGTTPWNKGKKASPEAIRNQSAAHLGQVAWNRRAIICLETGEIFESGAKAAKCLNLSTSKVSLVLNGKIKHTKGYTFTFL